MPVVEQQLTVGRDGRIERLALIQRPAQSLSGAGSWPMKVQVLLYYRDGRVMSLPVELRGDTTVVTTAEGMLAPAFVYPNAHDFGYGLFLLDDGSRDWLLASGVNVADPFLRAMLWGSLWDLVRDARLEPARYVEAALAALPRERDEQVASRLLGRVNRALDAYLARPTNGPSPLHRRAETLFLALAADSTRPYGIRKSYLDAYVGIAKSDDALARLDAWLDSATAAREPLRQPTRWAIVTRLMAAGHPGAHARLAAETRRDTTSGGRRRAFIAGAAEPSATTKRAWFTRYFADSTLNEDWVTASLGAFNDPDQSALTLQYLRPALDTLRWVQENRRIFFLGRWLDAFIGGHRSPQALAVVDAFLAEHPDLPRDLRQKVLQARDDLERTVRIRARFTR
jgi:aminopeptidase N